MSEIQAMMMSISMGGQVIRFIVKGGYEMARKVSNFFVYLHKKDMPLSNFGKYKTYGKSSIKMLEYIRGKDTFFINADESILNVLSKNSRNLRLIYAPFKVGDNKYKVMMDKGDLEKVKLLLEKENKSFNVIENEKLEKVMNDVRKNDNKKLEVFDKAKSEKVTENQKYYLTRKPEYIIDKDGKTHAIDKSRKIKKEPKNLYDATQAISYMYGISDLMPEYLLEEEFIIDKDKEPNKNAIKDKGDKLSNDKQLNKSDKILKQKEDKLKSNVLEKEKKLQNRVNKVDKVVEKSIDKIKKAEHLIEL